jgi:RES domain-containing protein
MDSFEPDPAVLEALASHAPKTWSGMVCHHTFADNPPDIPNGRGARWNPPGVSALYMSLDRDTALAEADHHIAVQPLRPRAKRTLHTLDVKLGSVLDLTDLEFLASLGVSRESLEGDDHSACRSVGGAAAYLGHDGILVPSARHSGVNLVIFTDNLEPDGVVRVRDAELIDPGRIGASSLPDSRGLPLDLDEK